MSHLDSLETLCADTLTIFVNQSSNPNNSIQPSLFHVIIIIIIERRDFGGIMSNDCKDTLQTQNKTVRVRRSRTSKVSIRYRRRQSCRNQESFSTSIHVMTKLSIIFQMFVTHTGIFLFFFLNSLITYTLTAY